MSPDGTRLVAGRARCNDARTAYRSQLVDVDLRTGATRQALPGEFSGGLPVFAHDGSLLHLSDRPLPDGRQGATLWRQRRVGEEPVPVITCTGGILNVAAAATAPVVVVKALMHPDAGDLDEDERIESDRRTTAVAFDSYPVRWWDSWLGPRWPRFLRVDLDSGHITDLTGPGDDSWWDVYGHGFGLTPDGHTVVANRRRHSGPGSAVWDLVMVRGRGVISLLADDADYLMPAVSPDGARVAVVRRDLGAPDAPERWALRSVRLDTGAHQDLLPDHELWPLFPTWSRDGAEVLFVADAHGRQPVFAAPAAGGELRVVSADASHDSLAPGPRGELYAVRSRIDYPPDVVAISGDGKVTPLPVAPAPPLPARFEEVVTRVGDTEVRSWLALPPDASAERPAPLLTWFHGGPAFAWSRWDWRWSAHVLAEHGWAMLLPDLAQSTGYGEAFRLRGRGDWIGQPVVDALACVASVAARPDIDATRLAAGGSSFGGYLTNAIAVQPTHPFRALVSVSGIWAMDQQRGASDSFFWFDREFGADERFLANSPHLHADRLATPMLVMHGEQDVRVTIDQSLRLFTDLQRRAVPSRLVVFPDEGHMLIGRPGALERVYAELLGWLDSHVS